MRCWKHIETLILTLLLHTLKHRVQVYYNINILLDQHKSSHDTISAYCFGFDVAANYYN